MTRDELLLGTLSLEMKFRTLSDSYLMSIIGKYWNGHYQRLSLLLDDVESLDDPGCSLKVTNFL